MQDANSVGYAGAMGLHHSTLDCSSYQSVLFALRLGRLFSTIRVIVVHLPSPEEDEAVGE